MHDKTRLSLAIVRRKHNKGTIDIAALRNLAGHFNKQIWPLLFDKSPNKSNDGGFARYFEFLYQLTSSQPTAGRVCLYVKRVGDHRGFAAAHGWHGIARCLGNKRDVVR